MVAEWGELCTQHLGVRCAQRSTGDLLPESRALPFGSVPVHFALLFLPSHCGLSSDSGRARQPQNARLPRPPPTAFSLSPSARGSHRPKGPPPSLMPLLWPSPPKVRHVHRWISRESWEGVLGHSFWLWISSYLKIEGEKKGTTHAAMMLTLSCTLFSDGVTVGRPGLNPYAR